MGSWTYGYDYLNRLSTAKTTAGGPFCCGTFTWSYDSFGNRQSQVFAGSTKASLYTPPTFTFSNATNQPDQWLWDQTGNLQYDNLNDYAYDGEGRLCAVENLNAEETEYLYDALGMRVAKGTSRTGDFNCNGPDSNGFTVTNNYIYGDHAEQLAEYDGSGNLLHENVLLDGNVLATFTQSTGAWTYGLNDWLGTRRLQVGANGSSNTLGFTSLPFGDDLSTDSNGSTAEDHFTGKDRDSESGNDYFGARYYESIMGRFLSPDPSGLLAQNPANPQSWNLYAYALNNPLTNIDPNGLDCVYANDAGNGVESIDHDSNSGECGNNGGTWAPGYVDENWAHFNQNTNMFQVGSVDGAGNNSTVDYTNFASGAQTDANGNCLSGCGGYGFASANANWLQGQLVGNSMFGGLDGYIQFLTGREQPLGGGLLNQLISGPLDPSTDHWAGPGGFGPPGGQGDWAASVHDYNFSQNGPAPGQGITIGMYFNPTISPQTARALIQSNNTLIRNAGGIQAVKMGMFFGVVNAFQWLSHAF